MVRWFRYALLLVLFALPLAAQNDSPDKLWADLKTDNREHFVAGTVTFSGLVDLRKQTDGPKGQEPPVAILSCADSRVPPEVIFNRSLAKVFVVRVAGNVADDYSLASLEYAVSKGWTKLIVVMGHSWCGAVESALNPANDGLTPPLIALVNRIRESFGPNWAAPPSLPDATKLNAKASAAWLPAHSAVIRDAVKSGRVKIVVAYYDLGSGKVEEVP
jgi:carbonic anhydrase